MREIPTELRNEPFSAGKAAQYGLTPKMLRGARFKRLVPGVYICADREATLLQHVLAALSIAPPGALVTGITGLHLHRVEIGDPLPIRLTGTHPHQIRNRSYTYKRVRQMPTASDRVCSASRCFADSNQLDLADLVAAGDRLVRLERATPQDLRSTAAALRGPGSARARRAAALVRAGVDSPRESRLRVCLVLAGLPEPRVNPIIGTEFEPIGRMDLVYLEYKIIIEYDGDHHRTDRTQWNTDIRRHEEAMSDGWLVIRVTGAHMQRPRALIRRVNAKLRSRGYAGPQPDFSNQWRAVFEPSSV